MYDSLVQFIAGGVAQLVRVSACHAEGREFEPRRPRHVVIVLCIVVLGKNINVLNHKLEYDKKNVE